MPPGAGRAASHLAAAAPFVHVRPPMTEERKRDTDLAPETEDEGGSTPPHPSQAEGAEEPGNGAERPPRPSQAEGDRDPE